MLCIRGFRIRRFDQLRTGHSIFTPSTADSQPRTENTISQLQSVESADGKDLLYLSKKKIYVEVDPCRTNPCCSRVIFLSIFFPNRVQHVKTLFFSYRFSVIHICYLVKHRSKFFLNQTQLSTLGKHPETEHDRHQPASSPLRTPEMGKLNHWGSPLSH